MDDELTLRCYELVTAQLCRDDACFDASVVATRMAGAGFAVSVEEVTALMQREREEVLKKVRRVR